MAKDTCKKKGRSKKDKALAAANTANNRALKLYRVCVRQPNNLQAVEALAQHLHPETIRHWLERIKP